MNIREQAAEVIGKGAATVMRWIAPTIEDFPTSYVFGAKGIMPGKDMPGGTDGMVLWRPSSGKRVSAAAAMARNTGWVYAATKAIADEIGNIEWRLFRIMGNDDQEELFDNEALDLLNGVNEHQTGVEFKHLIASHLEITGNAYILMLGADGKPVASYTDKPSSMTLLDPSRVSLTFDKSSYPYIVTGYRFVFEGREWTYAPECILHIKYPDPNDQYVGIGTVQGIPEWLDNDQAVLEWNRQFFLKGAKPSGTLTSPYKTEAQISRLRAGFEQSYGGGIKSGNGQNVAVLPEGVKFTADATPKDMDFGTLLDRMKERILAGFRVSSTILGSAEQDTNRATAETADYIFAKRTIKPKMMLITAYLNEFLIPRFGEDLYLSFNDPVPEDKEYRTTEMQAAVGSQPVISINEAREKYMGAGPVDGGDEVMVSTMYQPLGEPIPAKPEDGEEKAVIDVETKEIDAETRKVAPRRTKFTARPAAVPVYYVKAGKVTTRHARNAKIRAELSEAFAERFTKQLEAIKEKNLWDLTDEEYYNVWKDFASRVEKYEHKFAEGVRDLNDDQLAVVLANLSNATGVTKDVDPSKLFDVDKWTSLMIDFAGPLLKKLGKAEAVHAANAIGKPEAANVFDTPEHQAALDKSIALMADSYQKTTLDALKGKLDEGIRTGATLSELEASVRDVYAWSDERRAAMIAKTETFRIANDTTKETWKASGVVETIKWYTAEDDKVCGYCDDMDGTVISINENFYDKGDTAGSTVAGESMDLDYSDVGAPPLHPDCRCYVRPETVTV